MLPKGNSDCSVERRRRIYFDWSDINRQKEVVGLGEGCGTRAGDG
jgi:hypothetical protein